MAKTKAVSRRSRPVSRRKSSARLAERPAPAVLKPIARPAETFVEKVYRRIWP